VKTYIKINNTKIPYHILFYIAKIEINKILKKSTSFLKWIFYVRIYGNIAIISSLRDNRIFLSCSRSISDIRYPGTSLSARPISRQIPSYSRRSFAKWTFVDLSVWMVSWSSGWSWRNGWWSNCIVSWVKN